MNIQTKLPKQGNNWERKSSITKVTVKYRAEKGQMQISQITSKPPLKNVTGWGESLTSISLMTTEWPLQYSMFFPLGSPLITMGMPLSVYGRVLNTFSVYRNKLISQCFQRAPVKVAEAHDSLKV